MSHESWWSHNSAAIAVILAACLAATVAIINRRKELSHQRELDKTDYVRDTLEEALGQIDNFIGTSQRVALSLARRDQIEDPGQREKWEQEFPELIDAAQEDLRLMRARQVRLEIRLGDGSPATQRHRELLLEFNDWLEKMKALSNSTEPIAENHYEQKALAIQPTFRAFRQACRAWIEHAEARRRWWDQFRPN